MSHGGARCTHTTCTEPTTGAEPPIDRGGGATSRSRATMAAGPPVCREQPWQRSHQSPPTTVAAGPPVAADDLGGGATSGNSRGRPRGRQSAKAKGAGARTKADRPTALRIACPGPGEPRRGGEEPQAERRRLTWDGERPAVARRGSRARARGEGNGGPAGTGPLTSRLRQESGAGEDLGRSSGRAIRR